MDDTDYLYRITYQHPTKGRVPVGAGYSNASPRIYSKLGTARSALKNMHYGGPDMRIERMPNGEWEPA